MGYTPLKGWKVAVEPSGTNWRCRWRGKYGTDQATFVYKKDAQDKAEAVRVNFQRMDAGLSPIVAPTAPNFPAFHGEYSLWLEAKRSRRTLYLANNAIGLWVEFAGECFPVTRKMKAAGGGKTVDDFCAEMLKTRSPNGVRLVLRHLKASFRWAQKYEYIDRDPFLHFEMPPADKVARLLRPDEMAAILQHLPDVCARAAVFVLYTGLRIGEVLNLDWSGVDLGANGRHYLTVLKSKTRRAKAETKTQGIHPYALAAMGTHMESGKVFDVKLSRLSQNMARAARLSGVGRVRWHDLRHTWATHLMEQAKDLRALMDAGGWTTIQAAMIYQHPTEKRRDITLEMPYVVPSRPLIDAPRRRGPAKK